MLETISNIIMKLVEHNKKLENEINANKATATALAEKSKHITGGIAKVDLNRIEEKIKEQRDRNSNAYDFRANHAIDEIESIIIESIVSE